MISVREFLVLITQPGTIISVYSIFLMSFYHDFKTDWGDEIMDILENYDKNLMASFKSKKIYVYNI